MRIVYRNVLVYLTRRKYHRNLHLQRGRKTSGSSIQQQSVWFSLAARSSLYLVRSFSPVSNISGKSAKETETTNTEIHTGNKIGCSNTNNTTPTSNCEPSHQNADNAVCWNCKHFTEMSAVDRRLFCLVCDSLQPPLGDEVINDKYNYFTALNLPVSYNIDHNLLSSRYTALQRLLHPDKFHRKSQHEQEYSRRHSTVLNKAFKELQSPLSRAKHLLLVHGVNLSENETIEDPEFLMEVMDLREKIEEGNEEQLKELRKEIEAIVKEIAIDIGKAFDSKDTKKAKDLVNRLIYYVRMEEIIHEKLPAT